VIPSVLQRRTPSTSAAFILDGEPVGYFQRHRRKPAQSRAAGPTIAFLGSGRNPLDEPLPSALKLLLSLAAR
jgi:hypothetical protein